MKKASMIISILILLGNTVFPQDTDSVIKAHFVYSNSELDSFLIDNLVRPKVSQILNINAKVDIVFIVDTLGMVKNLQVIKFECSNSDTQSQKLLQILNIQDSIENLDSAFINEAKRVINFTNGLWYPAQANRKPIPSEISLSIMFENIASTESRTKWKKQHRYKSQSLPLLYGDYDVGMHKKTVTLLFDIPADNPTKYYNLGVKKLTQKKYLLAHKYFYMAVILNKSDADAWYNLGVTNHFLKNKTEACQCWIKAMQLGVNEAQENIEKYCKQ